MIELRFHRALYDGKALDETLKTYAGFADLEQAEEPSHWIVRVSASTPARERKIADEMANFALGLTIRSGGASA